MAEELTLFVKGRFESDPWSRRVWADTAGDLPEHSLLSMRDFLAACDAGAAMPKTVGVILDAEANLEALVPHLGCLLAMELVMSGFADGRIFSQARLLRERYGFDGTLRVAGSYILDQMPMLARCGVDAFIVEEPRVRAGLLRGEWSDFGLYYQPVGDQAHGAPLSRPWLRRAQGIL